VYKYPFRDARVIGPHTSECIKSKISLDLLSLLGNAPLTFLPRAQPLQSPLSGSRSLVDLLPFSLELEELYNECEQVFYAITHSS
jgi:hypothetical protein